MTRVTSLRELLTFLVDVLSTIWQIPSGNATLVKAAQLGRVTLADLRNGGATQVSPAFTCAVSPDFPSTFDAAGNWTSPLFAVSIAGVQPTGGVTWFQAEQACALSGKRLLTNQECQRAAAGTPDPGTDDGGTDCNIGGLPRPANTGSRAKCTSWVNDDTSGPIALMRAVLEEAARCIERGRQRRHPGNRALVAEAEAWVRCDSREWPFAFASICDVLGLEVDAVRSRLLADRKSPTDERRKPVRHIAYAPRRTSVGPARAASSAAS